MSISNKSVKRINKAVETQNTPLVKTPVSSKKLPPSAPDVSKTVSVSGITQKLPDYLL